MITRTRRIKSFIPFGIQNQNIYQWSWDLHPGSASTYFWLNSAPKNNPNNSQYLWEIPEGGTLNTDIRNSPGFDVIKFNMRQIDSKRVRGIILTGDTTSAMKVRSFNVEAFENLTHLRLFSIENIINLEKIKNLKLLYLSTVYSASGPNLPTYNLSNKPFLTDVYIKSNSTPAEYKEGLYTSLNSNGTSNGVASLPNSTTATANTAKTALTNRNWSLSIT